MNLDCVKQTVSKTKSSTTPTASIFSRLKLGRQLEKSTNSLFVLLLGLCRLTYLTMLLRAHTCYVMGEQTDRSALITRNEVRFIMTVMMLQYRNKGNGV